MQIDSTRKMPKNVFCPINVSQILKMLRIFTCNYRVRDIQQGTNEKWSKFALENSSKKLKAQVIRTRMNKLKSTVCFTQKYLNLRAKINMLNIFVEEICRLHCFVRRVLRRTWGSVVIGHRSSEEGLRAKKVQKKRLIHQ